MPAPTMDEVFEVLRTAGEASSDDVIAALRKRGRPGIMALCYAPMMRDWAGMGFLARRESSGSDPGRKRGTLLYRVTEKGEAHLQATIEYRAQLAKQAAEKKPPLPDFED